MVGVQPCPSGHPQLSLWDEPGPTSSEDILTEDSRTVGGVSPEPPADSVIVTRLLPKIAPPDRWSILGCDSSPSCGTPRSQALNETKTFNPSRFPPFSLLLALIFPRIPPEPRVPLSFPGAERLQLSDAALGELDMKLYGSRDR